MSAQGDAGASAEGFAESQRQGEREAKRWRYGAAQERRTARLLGQLPPGWHGWHDLAAPTRQANLDHLALGPAGVFAIDSKLRRYLREFGSEERAAQVLLTTARRLSRRLGVEVTSVQAVYGYCPALVADVEVVSSKLLVIWRCSLPPVLSDNQVRRLREQVEAGFSPRQSGF